MANALVASTMLGAALVGGIFFAFSTFVMTALGRLPPERGIAAMQEINKTVRNPWFFAVFFGTAVGAAVLLLLVVLDPAMAGSGYLIIGALFYLIGSVLVTARCNVPRNRALAGVAADSRQAAEIWAHYLPVWTRWNHVRTFAALAAAAAFLPAMG